jgi:signal transduction histidine kinase
MHRDSAPRAIHRFAPPTESLGRPALDRGRPRWAATGGLPRLRPQGTKWLPRSETARLNRFWVGCPALILAYYGAAHLGFALGFAGPVASIVWLPAGVSIAFLYLGGVRLWPGVVIADLLVNNYSAVPWPSAVAQTAGNALEAVLAALLLRRLVSPVTPFKSPRSVLSMFGAIAAGTFVSAFVGTLSTWIGGVIGAASLPRTGAAWWLGDFCGATMVVPLVLAWRPGAAQAGDRPRAVATALLAAALILLSYLSFRGAQPMRYLALPPMVWAAGRFGPREASAAVAVSVAFVIWGTTHYRGEFVLESIDGSLLATQLYVAITAVGTALVAALAGERRRQAAAIRAARQRVVVAADEERWRIERNLHDGAQARLAALTAQLSLDAQDAERTPASGATSFEAAREEVVLALEELRELVRGHHPAALRRSGLAVAIRELAARSSTPVEVTELPADRLDGSIEATAYYVILEAVTNAQRYSGASVIRVRAAATRSKLDIEIADDGVGGAALRANLGLEGLRDRVEALEGNLRIVSPPGQGTRVLAELPVPAS